MPELTWMGDAFALRVAATLLHFVWQGLVLALTAGLLNALLCNASARTRYTVNVGLLFAMVACLPLTFVALNGVTVEITQSSLEASSQVAVLETGETSSKAEAIDSTRTHSQSTELNAATVSTQNRVRDISNVRSDSIRASIEVSASDGFYDSEFFRRLTALAPFITWAYFVGVLVMAGRLVVGLRGGQSLRRHSLPVVDARLLDMVREQAARIELRCVPAIAFCERISVPIVIGVMRPMILLPATLVSGLSSDQLQALITHELSHIHRYDLLVNLLQRIVEAVLFFHPAVWFVSRRVSRERENVADDAVLAAGWPAVRYADALVRMAELSSTMQCPGRTTQVAALAATGSSSSEFKRRVIRLLSGSSSSQIRLSRSGILAMTLVTVSLLMTPVVVQLTADDVPLDSFAASTVDDTKVRNATVDPGRTETSDVETQSSAENAGPSRVAGGFVTGPGGAIADAKATVTYSIVDEGSKNRLGLSIARASNYLLKRQRADGSWNGNTEGRGYAVGTTAMVALALFESGNKSDEAIQKATQFLLKASPKMTKEIALQTIFLHRLGKPGAALRRRNLKWLIDSQIKNGSDAGGWGYQRDPLGARADGANSAFAIQALTLVASRDSENPDGISGEFWQRSIKWLLATQHKDGCWGYTIRGSQSSGAMTACGLAGLKSLKLRVDSTPEVEQAINKAEAWLDRNWSVENAPSSAWPLFHFEWLCRSLRDTPILGERDWYSEVREIVLKSQREDGSFVLRKSTVSPTISTVFALEVLRNKPEKQLHR